MEQSGPTAKDSAGLKRFSQALLCRENSL